MLALVLFVVAVCVATCLQWCLPRAAAALPADRLFVGLVSFRDAGWPTQVEHMLATAESPHRLRFGVVEYVRHAADAVDLPARWRDCVRVHTVSHRIARSLREARTLCLDQLHQNEPAVLFVRAAEFVRGWDARLGATAGITTARLDERATFPCLRLDATGARVQPRAMRGRVDLPVVPILLWQAELVFAYDLAALRLALEHTDGIKVSLALHAAGVPLVAPTQPLARLGHAPRGLPMPSATHDLASARALLRQLGVSEVEARMGVTAGARADELVAKYGSLAAARVRRQSLASRAAA